MNLAAHYVEKWNHLLPAVESIEPNRSVDSIKQVYEFLQFPAPVIVYASQPNLIFSTFLQHKLIENYRYCNGIATQPPLTRKQEVKLKHQLGTELARTFTDEVLLRLAQLIRKQIGSDLESQLWVSIENFLRQKIAPGYSEKLRNFVDCRKWFCYAAKFDLCINELKVSCDPQLWDIFQSLVMNCDWFIPFTKMCLVGDLPVTKFIERS